MKDIIRDKRGIFVTATGTDIGKTYVSALLVEYFRNQGLNVGYYKPVLSGAVRQSDNFLLAGDCDYVVNFTKLNVIPSDCVTYCFEDPVSPHLAAERVGVSIDFVKIKAHFESLLKNKFDKLVVEGAGGITCPLNLSETKLLLSDLILDLGLDVVLVADAGLGTINSVLLTVEYAKLRGINIVGIILNNYDASNFVHIDNKLQIQYLTGIRVVAIVEKNGKSLTLF